MVQAEYRVQMAELAKSQIGLRASIREIWEWELEEKNWELLKKEFSPLPKCGSREERFKALENLDPSFRAQVDAYSRNCLVDLNPSWIEEALQTAAKVERTIPIYGPDAVPFVRLPAIEKGEGLGLLLIQAAQQDREALAALKNYSYDGTVFFRFENVQKMGEKQILSFEAARKTVLTELTNKVLQKEYLKIRSKFPQKLKQASGEWKPFSEVKNEVGKIVFADLVKALDPIVKNESGQKEKGEDAYAVYRLAALSKRALEDLKKDPADPHWVQAEDPLLRQFKLERKEAKIQRNLKEDWMQEEAFVLMPNQWSPVRVAEEGQIVFFYLQERKPAEAPIFDLLSFGKEILAADAQRYLAERLLETAKQKNAIILPLQEGTLQGNQTGEQDEPL
jgi:hypothetical protein